MVATNSSSSSTMVAANSQWLVPSICCTLMATNPTDFRYIFKNYKSITYINLDTEVNQVGEYHFHHHFQIRFFLSVIMKTKIPPYSVLLSKWM